MAILTIAEVRELVPVAEEASEQAIQFHIDAVDYDIIRMSGFISEVPGILAKQKLVAVQVLKLDIAFDAYSSESDEGYSRTAKVYQATRAELLNQLLPGFIY